MTLRIFLAALLLGGAASFRAPEPAADKIKVVATIPDLADIATRIGGDRLDITTIAKGTENVHAVVVRPSHLVAVNKADVFLQIGLALEHSFVPGLMEKGRNWKIMPGAPGFVNVSEGWEPINVPVMPDRSQAADVHLMGNPHINLDPTAGRHMAKRILDGLVASDPEGEEVYRAGHASFLEDLEKAEKRWAKRAELFRGKKLVIYHPDINYFARHYGMQLVGTIEPRPGLPPKPRNLLETIDLIEREEVEVILTARWSNNKNVRFIADKSGAQVLEIPIMVRGVAGSDSWIGMMDFLHDELAKVFDPKGGGAEEDGG